MYVFFYRLLQIIPILMFHSHLMSCILAVIACPALSCPYSKPRCSPKTWITNTLLRDEMGIKYYQFIKIFNISMSMFYLL